MKNIDRLLCVVMDGIGQRTESVGNAVHAAFTPHMDRLRTTGLYRTLYSHGQHVGLPTDQDMGNSEVGHNTLGAGRIVDQGATLVHKAIASGTIYQGSTWQKLMAQMKKEGAILHFIGLLSDGMVHSHENHLYSMLEQACKEGIACIRLHLLFDGRDVAPRSAQKHVNRLKDVITRLSASYDTHIRVASGGGRGRITMDRYGADWHMVKRGWDHHVLAHGDMFESVDAALSSGYQQGCDNDQHLPPFIIHDPHGRTTIEDGDGVVCFHFRPDRAIEISQAFCEQDFSMFDRKRHPKVFYCGMTSYDADKNLPQHVLVNGVTIDNPLTETLLSYGLRQFACSESHKFGHVTFFWNGNRWGYFDEQKEEYLQIPSLKEELHLIPWMSAHEITTATIQRLYNNSFDFGRINFANGDMIGHTGDFHAAVIAVSVVDYMLGRLIKACQETQTTLVITADHGNCETMYMANDPNEPKTSHSIEKVPLYIVPAKKHFHLRNDCPEGGLAHMAGTMIHLMNLSPHPDYYPSLLVHSKT
ncbi:MAG: 2,3-bisphosphoglycerate-independent phosphoglycerate mutase [Proteobacteria bacterium]|nr:2,3-bisphosphoglycerate-independent phosphoglycerate mutase [Pseudomonadota bacterium]